MERHVLFFLCICLTFPAFAQEGERRDEFSALVEHFEKLGKLFRQSAEQAAHAVVNIQVSQNRPFGGRGSRTPKLSVEESGSGMVAVIDQKQVILTNRHVIGEADRDAIQILTYDRRILTLTKIVSNEEFDIALIEVAEKLSPSAMFGNSDQVQVGDIVLALGNPFGLDRSISMGIISAVGRRNAPGTSTAVPRIDFFQTDAAVNPGSSGGMLLNLRGEVIGILTAIATQGGKNEGVAFVMPINAVLRIAEQLVQKGTVVKPFMGFASETITTEDRRRLALARLIGAKVKTIASDTPAERSGLKVGDVVLSFNDIEVEDELHILHLVALSEIDKPVVLGINRNGEILNVIVTPTAQLSR